MRNSPSYWYTKDSIELSKSLILARDISCGAKNTLHLLLLYGDRDEISMSQGRFAEELGKSESTINRHFLQLEEKEYIILIRKPGYSNEIQFTTKSCVQKKLNNNKDKD